MKINKLENYELSESSDSYSIKETTYTIRVPISCKNINLVELLKRIPMESHLIFIDRPTNVLNNIPVEYYEVGFKFKL